MKNLYVIHDLLAKESYDIMEAPNDDVALRKFRNGMRENRFADPADYRLYMVGTMDHETNMVFGEEKPIEIEIKAPKEGDI